MAERTIVRLFENAASAHAAIAGLEAAGFPHDDITYMGQMADFETANDRARIDPVTGTPVIGDPVLGTAAATGPVIDDRRLVEEDVPTDSGAATGATIGTVVGGGAALLAGLGAIAIPGIGPLVAAGWLITTVAGAGVGAAAGGLLGALTTAGLGSDHAETYEEGVRRGGHLVAVRTDDSRAAEAENVLARYMPIDMDERQVDWRADGWDRPTPTGMPTVTAPMAEMPPTGTTGRIGSAHPMANDPTRPYRGDVA